MMKRLSELQIQELESFGYIVRNNESLENQEKKAKQVAREQRPVSVKKSINTVDDVEVKPAGKDAEHVEPLEHLEQVKKTDDYSYLDELET